MTVASALGATGVLWAKATVPVAQATATKPATNLRMTFSLRGLAATWVANVKSAPLERDPQIAEQHVVVGRVAAEAVVVRRRAVELRVERVLQAELHVQPQHIVDFGDAPGAVRVAADGAEIRRIVRSVDAEDAEAGAELA